MHVAGYMLRALQKIKMAEVSEHIQSRIFHICCKITVFAGMFISLLPQCMWPPKLMGWALTMKGSQP